MSHHIYHTRGIILSAQPSGESNRFFKIFTDEIGLVGATAQSVREGKSKLRYTLQERSLVTVDLVRGKEVWRIVSAGPWQSLDKVKSDTVKAGLLSGYYTLLTRLIQGEGRDAGLFEEIVSVASYLDSQEFSPELTLAFETLTAFRVLVHLGYIDPLGYEKFLEPHDYSSSLLNEFEKIRPQTLAMINQALSASHL